MQQTLSSSSLLHSLCTLCQTGKERTTITPYPDKYRSRSYSSLLLPPMASLLESGWQFLITHFSDFQLACLGSFFIHESIFFLSGLPFIFLERAGWLSKYKIQHKNNSPAAQEKCITRLLLYHFGVNLPVMILSYPVFKHMGMKSSLPLPSWYFQVLYILNTYL
ncbi:Methylsterol monooxygenase 2-2 [Linum perenne]